MNYIIKTGPQDKSPVQHGRLQQIGAAPVYRLADVRNKRQDIPGYSSLGTEHAPPLPFAVYSSLKLARVLGAFRRTVRCRLVRSNENAHLHNNIQLNGHYTNHRLLVSVSQRVCTGTTALCTAFRTDISSTHT